MEPRTKTVTILPAFGTPVTLTTLPPLVDVSSTRAADPSLVRAYAEAFEVIPYTLAENAGLNPIAIVTDLRNKHASGQKTAGINVKKGVISDMLKENVVQPLLVTTSAVKLATETVAMILKIDDIILCR